MPFGKLAVLRSIERMKRFQMMSMYAGCWVCLQTTRDHPTHYFSFCVFVHCSYYSRDSQFWTYWNHVELCGTIQWFQCFLRHSLYHTLPSLTSSQSGFIWSERTSVKVWAPKLAAEILKKRSESKAQSAASCMQRQLAYRDENMKRKHKTITAHKFKILMIFWSLW